MYKTLGVKWLFEVFCPALAFATADRDEARNPQRFIHVSVSTNSMKTKITEIIIEELLNPTFEMTRQFLKILEINQINNIPQIAKIERIQNENKVIAYVEVKNESFYLEFYFDTSDNIEITSVDTAPFIGIRYMPTSEELSLDKLLNLTTLKPTEKISKGDFFSNGKFEYTYNGLVFETYPEPGNIDSKLNYLLDFFESDITGIRELSEQTNCKDLFITIVYHIGNNNFTGLFLDNQIIERLSKLGLGLTFDIYASGKSFISE
jgi:hypothetical protein